MAELSREQIRQTFASHAAGVFEGLNAGAASEKEAEETLGVIIEELQLLLPRQRTEMYTRLNLGNTSEG